MGCIALVENAQSCMAAMTMPQRSIDPRFTARQER
jgi:hypothetical protein